MFKRFLCLAMALVMVAGMAMIGVSAATEEVSEVAADTKIYFEVPSDWKNYTKIMCYIWEYGGEKFANWESKKTICTKVEEGLYSYDPYAKTKNSLEAGKNYCVIFSADTGVQTYDLFMSNACYGDTAYCDGTKLENPADSNKTAIACYWKNQDKTKYGPAMVVTSIGNVVGTCIVPGETAQSMFTSFITGDSLGSARTYSGKTDQQIIDDTAKALGLSQDSVESLIKKSGVEIAWKKAESSAPKVDTGVAAGGGSSNPSNPNATTTGQEMTIVYIAVAMMLASAAVVIFVRRKKVTE
ncbi:MAG: LPXTG cell wall anchor domain-containing protein [Clostridia bacterium]|nr:LPXTG cell wall anchor domain-containing protein [Clostridia bacterium]